LLFLRPLF